MLYVCLFVFVVRDSIGVVLVFVLLFCFVLYYVMVCVWFAVCALLFALCVFSLVMFALCVVRGTWRGVRLFCVFELGLCCMCWLLLRVC